MAFFWQVFFSERKVSRHGRPSSLRVLPLIFRMVTGSVLLKFEMVFGVGMIGL